jgi:hypothetical protein
MSRLARARGMLRSAWNTSENMLANVRKGSLADIA